MEPGHPCGVKSIAVVVEAQDREASLDDGTPGRVHGSHQPEFSVFFGGADKGGGRRVGRRLPLTPED